MRALAFKNVSASAVAVIEDHVIVPPLGQAALDALARGATWSAGPIENAATDARRLARSSSVVSRRFGGRSDVATGNNIAYR
jgi:hypothetical protein